MSRFTVKCGWCGETLTNGIVGSTLVGTGHACEVRIPCDAPGCDKLSDAAMTEVAGSRAFRCVDHVLIGMNQWQSRA
jgi:hypothetical protein